MKRAPAVLLILVLLLIFTTASLAADPAWNVLRTDHFLIYYTPGRESMAGDAGKTAEKWRVILSRKLGFAPTRTVPIYLYPDRRSFVDATGVSTRQQIVGLAHTRTLRVRVDASRLFADIDHIIPHELVHVFISDRLKQNAVNMPLWMHEGLAKYLGDDWSGPDAELLSDTVTGGGLIPLSQLTYVFPDDSRQQSVAYVEGYSAVKYMADLYSAQCIPDLISELSGGLSFQEALFRSIGVRPDRFEMDWHQYLWKRYGIGRWTRFATGMAWFVMAVLAILAFRSRIMAKRRKAKEFEEEDPSEDVEE